MSQGWDALKEEALEKLEGWSAQARQLFEELVEDAASEMQRELLQRAVAAGHSPAEIHAFADELRALPDPEAFDACTLGSDAPKGYTVEQLLRAEADPLYAYELKGHSLSPADDHGVPHSEPSLRPGPPPRFDRPPPSALKELGQSVDAIPGAARAAPALKLMEDLLNESAHRLGVVYLEQDVDDANLTLESALVKAAAAIGRGIVIPIALGPAAGHHRRLAILLQLSTFSGKRAWQIYDPFSGERVWVSEGDLLARTELPFSIKTNRRITRIALPLATSLGGIS